MRLLLAAVFFVFAVMVVCGFENADPCLNGGELQHGQCGCPLYFNGTKCEHPLCINNGTMNEDGRACTCPQGFTGPACQFPSCTENSNATVINDYKQLILLVEVSAATKDALQSLADNIESIYNNALDKHKDWLGSIIVYAMNADGTNSTEEFSLPTLAATYLKDLATEATEAGYCSMPIWESLDDIFLNYKYIDRSQLVLITAAIPQVNGTDFIYAMNHFTTEAPTFDFIHVESDACPMMHFKQNYTEFVNFVVSFNGIFLRSTQADVAKTLQTLLPTRYVAQRISISPHLPDINCKSDKISILVDAQTTEVYITVAGNGATVRAKEESFDYVATTAVVNTTVQMVWRFTPPRPGFYSVEISSDEDLCFPVVYSDGIQVVLAFAEHWDTDTVLFYPLRVFENFPVLQQYGRGDVLGTLDYITTRRYYLEPATWWHVVLRSQLSPHENCAYNWIGENFDKMLDDFTTFTIQGTDKQGNLFERSISARSHFYDGPTTSTTQWSTTNSTAPVSPSTQGPSQPTVPNESTNNPSTEMSSQSPSVASSSPTVPTTMSSSATSTLIPTTSQPTTTPSSLPPSTTVPKTISSTVTTPLIQTTNIHTTALPNTLPPRTVAPASSTEADQSTASEATTASSTLVSSTTVSTIATSTIPTSTTVLVNTTPSTAAISTVPTPTTNLNNSTTSMPSTSTPISVFTNATSVLPDGTTSSSIETTTKSTTVSSVLLATALTLVMSRILL